MITTTPCDNGNHSQCPGKGLISGVTSSSEERLWMTVTCDCPCHILINPPDKPAEREAS